MSVDYLTDPDLDEELRQLNSVITGVLVGFDDDHQPLVTYGEQPSAAVRARSTMDVHAAHIGKEVVLALERGDPQRPIIIGCLRGPQALPTTADPGQVQLDVDGERLLVTAKRQLVLRCGRASITLTCNGKILIDGAYVSSTSSGVNRIKGGSVQLN
jgi:hypothetical protein